MQVKNTFPLSFNTVGALIVNIDIQNSTHIYINLSGSIYYKNIASLTRFDEVFRSRRGLLDILKVTFFPNEYCVWFLLAYQ